VTRGGPFMKTDKGGKAKPSIPQDLFKEQPCIGRGCKKIIKGILECNYITTKERCGCPQCPGCGEEKNVGPFCQECYITSNTIGQEVS